MIVRISDKFQKDIKKIKDKILLGKIQNLIASVELIVHNMSENQEIPDVPNMIKLSGHENYYRIRLGNYRIGISIENQAESNENTDNEIIVNLTDDIFWFERFGHRKDFYRIFP